MNRKELQALQKHWNEILKRSGFDDIEIYPGSPNSPLKRSTPKKKPNKSKFQDALFYQGLFADPKIQKALVLLKAGKSFADIANELKISESKVKSIKKQYEASLRASLDDLLKKTEKR